MRGYGQAASDIEGNWDKAFKEKIKKIAFKTILQKLTVFQRIRLFIYFIQEKKRAAALDLSDIRAKGLQNESFIKQQLEYLSLFSALVKIFDREKAIAVMNHVMDATAEALFTSLPEQEEVKKFADPFEFFREYMVVLPKVSMKAGCHHMIMKENSKTAIQFNIHYCVWFELAKKMNLPEACIPNCYSDDLIYPAYFNSFGIKYCRTQTLAKGGECCDFRFEKMQTDEKEHQCNKVKELRLV